MRLFLAIPSSPNPSFASGLWKANLHDPLVSMGHDVVLWDEGIGPLFDLDPGQAETALLRAQWTARFIGAIESAHRERPLDLAITYLSDSHLEPEAIDRVRDRIAPIANFFCNNIHQFHLVRRNASRYSACLVPEHEAMGRYREAGAEPLFFPMAANPERYRPVPVPVRYDVTFAGQRYADRASSILALREAGIDAHAFGQHWDDPRQDEARGRARGNGSERPRGTAQRIVRGLELAFQGKSPLRAAQDRRDWARLQRRHPVSLHGPLDDDGYVALFSESRISLGFLVLGDSHRTTRPLRQVRLREFEGPMAGAFYITEWIPEIALHYEVGKEIVCARSRAELVDLCRYYLLHEEERERIRRAGHERARRDHTWERRFVSLFDELCRRGILRAKP
jgi:spore maturation protein CgeB